MLKLRKDFFSKADDNINGTQACYKRDYDRKLTSLKVGIMNFIHVMECRNTLYLITEIMWTSNNLYFFATMPVVVERVTSWLNSGLDLTLLATTWKKE